MKTSRLLILFLIILPLSGNAFFRTIRKTREEYFNDVHDKFKREVEQGKIDKTNFSIIRFALENYDSKLDLKYKCLSLSYERLNSNCITERNNADSVQSALDEFERLKNYEFTNKSFKDPSDGATGTSSSNAGDIGKGILIGEGARQLSKIADTARDYYTEKFLDSVSKEKKVDQGGECRSSNPKNCRE